MRLASRTSSHLLYSVAGSASAVLLATKIWTGQPLGWLGVLAPVCLTLLARFLQAYWAANQDNYALTWPVRLALILIVVLKYTDRGPIAAWSWDVVMTIVAVTLALTTLPGAVAVAGERFRPATTLAFGLCGAFILLKLAQLAQPLWISATAPLWMYGLFCRGTVIPRANELRWKLKERNAAVREHRRPYWEREVPPQSDAAPTDSALVVLAALPIAAGVGLLAGGAAGAAFGCVERLIHSIPVPALKIVVRVLTFWPSLRLASQIVGACLRTALAMSRSRGQLCRCVGTTVATSSFLLATIVSLLGIRDGDELWFLIESIHAAELGSGLVIVQLGMMGLLVVVFATEVAHAGRPRSFAGSRSYVSDRADAESKCRSTRS